VRIAILGASGNAGRAVARMLRAHTPHDLLLLGRNPERLERALSEVRRTACVLPGGAASATVGHALLPASAPSGLTPALRGQDVLIVAAPLSGDVAPWVRATLDADCDWYDLTLSVPGKWAALRALEPRASERGRSLVTDGGVHPGLPGMLVRLAASRIHVRRAWVAMRFGVAWSDLRVSRETVVEFAGEIARYDPRLLLDGAWVRGWRYARRFDFGPPVGPADCAPMYLEELAQVRASLPDIAELGFFVAGFGPVVDYAVMPAAGLLALAGAVGRGLGTELLSWGLRTFGDTPGPSVVLLVAEGPGEETLRLSLSADDAYVLTAAPVAALLMQWESARRPGLSCQAMSGDPERLLRDMEDLGVASRLC
jgi:hypothetical protein